MSIARLLAVLTIPLVVLAVLPLGSTWHPFAPEAAYAQQTPAKRSAKQKTPAPKSTPVEPPARIAFTAQDQAAAVIPGIADARIWGDSAKDFVRVLPSMKGPWLAVSGGGADGAFAAGILTGWSQANNRPEFTVVTGSSIGAMIAPFAFVGPKYDEQLRNDFTTITAADLFEDHVTPESLLDTWPLKRLIEKRVTPQLLSEIATEHRRGRRLLVVTSNLDAGRRVLWNMGAIAERGDDTALKLFREILLASASIPGFFPPVAITAEANGKQFQEMHIDGSVTAPFFIVPEDMLAAGNGSNLPASQIYVIVNSKLAPEFSMPERKLHSVLGRFISVALTTALRVELLLTINGMQRLGTDLSIAYVEPSFQHPSRSLFDDEYMRALFEYAANRARQGAAFENSRAKVLQGLDLR